jgi:hypothetical protein
MTTDRDFDLVRWETLFADGMYPSVRSLPEPGERLRVVVAPQGIERYPKYLVDFDGAVVVYLNEDES